MKNIAVKYVSIEKISLILNIVSVYAAFLEMQSILLFAISCVGFVFNFIFMFFIIPIVGVIGTIFFPEFFGVKSFSDLIDLIKIFITTSKSLAIYFIAFAIATPLWYIFVRGLRRTNIYCIVFMALVLLIFLLDKLSDVKYYLHTEIDAKKFRELIYYLSTAGTILIFLIMHLVVALYLSAKKSYNIFGGWDTKGAHLIVFQISSVVKSLLSEKFLIIKYLCIFIRNIAILTILFSAIYVIVEYQKNLKIFYTYDIQLVLSIIFSIAAPVVILAEYFRGRGNLTSYVFFLFLVLNMLFNIFIEDFFVSSGKIETSQAWLNLLFIIIIFAFRAHIFRPFVNIYDTWRTHYRLHRHAKLNSGSYILYLRSFSDDPVKISISEKMLGFFVNSKRPQRYIGDVISDICYSVSPMITVNNTDVHSINSGIVVKPKINSTWQEEVSALISNARYIIYLPGKTPGLQWELSEIFKLDALSKTIFFMPTDSHAKLLFQHQIFNNYHHTSKINNNIYTCAASIKSSGEMNIFFTRKITEHHIRMTILMAIGNTQK